MLEQSTSAGQAEDTLQVLDRTFAILELFTPLAPEWTTTEVARACALPIPTAHRLLNALQRGGYVARNDATKRFRLGVAALRLGQRARDSTDLRALALPILRQLSYETGETTLLTAPNDTRDRSLCVERVESAQSLRLAVQPGRLLPLHAGASQKIILAYMDHAEQELILSLPLAPLGRATITDSEVLRAELTHIRSCGYAVSAEETNEGVWGIAVPILDGRQFIVAGVGIAGPLSRRSQGRETRDLAALRSAAGHLATSLGLTQSRQPDTAPLLNYDTQGKDIER